MPKNLLTSLGLVVAASCSQNEPPEQPVTRASAAIQALTTRDEARVAQCNNAVDACNERVPDAAADGLCARLAAHCDEVNARLAEVREPVVGCWRALEECAEHTPEQAQCNRDESRCEALETDADEERGKVVDCSARVEACLERAADKPEAAAVACENIAAACENAEAAGDGAGNGRDAGAPSDEDEDEDDGDDNGDNGDDGAGEDGDGDGEDDDEGRGGRGPGDRPIAPPPDRGRPDDAGAPRR